RRAELPQPGKVTDEHPHQLTLVFPEIREELPLFLWRQKVGGEDGGLRHGRRLLGGRLALATSRLHCYYYSPQLEASQNQRQRHVSGESIGVNVTPDTIPASRITLGAPL